MEKLKDRLWLPHQAGLEFHENRMVVISDQAKSYDTVSDQFRKLLETFGGERRHPFLSEQTMQALTSTHQTIAKELSQRQQRLRAMLKNDEVLDKLTRIFELRVGDSFSDDERDKIYKEGKDRFDRKIPPGFCDANKGEPRMYGDLLLWRQLIRKAQSEECPIILVCDDSKEDWWRIHDGQTFGPRIELLEEIRSEAEQPFWMYGSPQFTKWAGERLKAQVGDEAINEMKQVAEEDRQRAAFGLPQSALDQLLEAPQAHERGVLASALREALQARETAEELARGVREMRSTPMAEERTSSDIADHSERNTDIPE